MPEYDLNFSPFSSNEADSFKLVELTPDLTALIENAISNSEDIRYRPPSRAMMYGTRLPLS